MLIPPHNFLPVRKYINPIIIGLIFLVITAFASKIGSRGAVGFSIFFCIYLFIKSWPEIKIVTSNNAVLFGVFFLICFMGTTYSIITANNFSLFQFARSQIWSLILPIMGLAYFRKGLNFSSFQFEYLFKVIETYFLLITLVCIFELLTGEMITPVYIRAINEDNSFPRLYMIGMELVSPLFPIFLIRKKYLSALCSFFILILTGGKSALLTWILAVFYWAFSRKVGNFKRFLVVGFLFAVTFFYVNYIGSRIYDFYDSGDSRRMDQIYDGVSFIEKSPITILIGGGLGTPYSEAYYKNDMDHDALYEQKILLENSRYDIENGYVYMLVRFGLIGTILYLLILFRSFGRYKPYVILSYLLFCLGSSPTGASTAVEFAFFGISAAYISRIPKNV